MTEQIGPKIELNISCYGCKYHKQTYHGIIEPPHYLEDPDEHKCFFYEVPFSLGEHPKTPKWCPIPNIEELINITNKLKGVKCED